MKKNSNVSKDPVRDLKELYRTLGEVIKALNEAKRILKSAEASIT